MFQGSAWHFELIFKFWAIPKCDLVEVEKAMLQGLACQFELIFSVLTNRKCDLGEVEKTMFKVSHGTLNLFWTCGLAQNAISMKSKKR